MKKNTNVDKQKLGAASGYGAALSAIGFALLLGGCQSNSTSVDYQDDETAVQGDSSAYDRTDLLRSGGTRAYSSQYESIGIFQFHHSEKSKPDSSKYFMVSENDLMPGN